MGINLFKLTRPEYKKRGNASGKSVTATGSGLAGQTITAEIYSVPGVIGIPGENTHGIWIPVGSDRYGIIIAFHNYQIALDLNKGDVNIYSTTENGATVKSLIALKNDGTIEMNGSDKRFVTYAELDTALQNLVSGINTTFSTKKNEAGSAGTLTLDISAAETQTIKTGG
jgi:hypothetical protein